MEDVVVGNKINLLLMNGAAYVWNSEDWLKLRSYRIIGSFFGNLAALPRQYQFTGLPLALTKEETTLLLEKNYATLKTLPDISDPPNNYVKLKCASSREKLFSEQKNILINKRKKEIETKINIIIKGKKAKLKNSNFKESEKILTNEEILQEELNRIQLPKESRLSVQISTGDPWLEENDYKEISWNYPTTPQENLKYFVFKDLYTKGFYITCGGKFGGDYLAYSGDPVKFHALFIVVCVDKKKKLNMKEIIKYGRLGQSVRKTVALASLNDDNDVEYQSVQWAGI